jgi:hypothetical protein
MVEAHERDKLRRASSDDLLAVSLSLRGALSGGLHAGDRVDRWEGDHRDAPSGCGERGAEVD